MHICIYMYTLLREHISTSCFSSISMDSDYHNAVFFMFIDSE